MAFVKPFLLVIFLVHSFFSHSLQQSADSETFLQRQFVRNFVEVSFTYSIYTVTGVYCKHDTQAQSVLPNDAPANESNRLLIKLSSSERLATSTS